MIEFDDARALTETERQRLARMMYLAFCDLRVLTMKSERIQQAYDLADAFHNAPLLMHRNDFSVRAFLKFLEHYQRKYEGRLMTDFLKEWEKPNATS